jgi:hypothetical protein
MLPLCWYINPSNLFTDSFHIKFGRPLPLFLLLVRVITPLWIGASTGLRWIYPNHLKRCCTSFFSTGATPSLSHMSSFRTRSLLVWPQIHRSMHISATLSCWTCRLIVGQYSAPYNMVGSSQNMHNWNKTNTSEFQYQKYRQSLQLLNVNEEDLLHKRILLSRIVLEQIAESLQISTSTLQMHWHDDNVINQIDVT